MRDNKSARKVREGTEGKSAAWFSQRERREGLLLCSLLEQDRLRFPKVSATHAVVVLNHPTKSSRKFKAKKRLTSGQNASILAGTRHNTPWTPRQDDLHPNSNKERVDPIRFSLSPSLSLTFTRRSSSSNAATQASRHLLTKHCRIHALALPRGVETLLREATAPTVLRTLDSRRSRVPGRLAPPARGTRSTRSRKAQKGSTPGTVTWWGGNAVLRQTKQKKHMAMRTFQTLLRIVWSDLQTEVLGVSANASRDIWTSLEGGDGGRHQGVNISV